MNKSKKLLTKQLKNKQKKVRTIKYKKLRNKPKRNRTKQKKKKFSRKLRKRISRGSGPNDYDEAAAFYKELKDSQRADRDQSIFENQSAENEEKCKNRR